MTTKIYRNDSKKAMNVLGVGEIPAGEQVSLTSEYPPAVVLANYPGLVDVVAEEEVAKSKKDKK